MDILYEISFIDTYIFERTAGSCLYKAFIAQLSKGKGAIYCPAANIKLDFNLS
jgi:hypothetical protein